MYLGEDSFFLADELKKYLNNNDKNRNKNIKLLDIGSGSGIQARVCSDLGFRNILCVDIASESVSKLKKEFRAIKSDLFEKIEKTAEFDLIIFNPPYLPACKYDKKKDTTGGKLGDETIIRFLKQAKSHLNKNGKIILLLSSLTPRKKIEKIIKQNYKKEKIAEKNFFFEILEIWVMSLS